jgi:predicted metal-dependent phosphoesterase TrpH
VRIRGAIHMHSIFSHDGTLSVAELAALYRRNNYQFIAITEHAEDLDGASAERLLDQCREQSRDGLCVIPGSEFSCGEFHILGIGVVTADRPADAIAAAETIHHRGGMAVLAHPKRFGWKCPVEVLRAVDAVEIWNVGYDGKFLPSARAAEAYAAMKRAQPPLLAVAGHDFHRQASFYDVALVMDAAEPTTAAILSNLHQGRYVIKSRFFRAGPDGKISKPRPAFLRMLSGQLSTMRRARSLVAGLLS